MVDGKEVLSVYRDGDRVPDLRYEDLKRGESVAEVPGCCKGTNLRFVLCLQIRSSEEFGVDPLQQPGMNLAPWCPNGKADVEGACDGEDDVPDDPPQEGIQEEEYEIHQIHDGQGEGDLVSAEHHRSTCRYMGEPSCRPWHRWALGGKTSRTNRIR